MKEVVWNVEFDENVALFECLFVGSLVKLVNPFCDSSIYTSCIIIFLYD